MEKSYILCAVVLMSMVLAFPAWAGAKGPGEAAHVENEGRSEGEAVAEVPAAAVAATATAEAPVEETKVVGTLTRRHIKITEVKRGPETKIEGTTLYIREGIEEEAVASQELVHQLKIDIITPDQYHTYSNTIMDVQPIATKEGEDEIGTGTTRVLDGVIMMVTGTDDNGVQIGEFGSSEGYLDENIMWDVRELLIKVRSSSRQKLSSKKEPTWKDLARLLHILQQT